MEQSSPVDGNGGWIGITARGGSGFLHGCATAECAAGDLWGGLNLGLKRGLGGGPVFSGFVDPGPVIRAGTGEAEGGESGEERGSKEEFGGFHGIDGFCFSNRTGCAVVCQSYTAGTNITQD